MAIAAACTIAREGYSRHRPELTDLYRLIETHWPKFLERAEQAGGLPSFVIDEFEGYLDCGIVQKGCALLECPACGLTHLVAWSCKNRGFCPSCLGRRMNDLAVHLTDDVFPRVRIRQWICSMPWSLRTLLGYDSKLCSEVLGAFTRELERSYRWRAKHHLSLRSVTDAHFGAVTIVQRFDSALRLNPHFHVLCLDGVYVRDRDGRLVFHQLTEPTFEEVADVAARTASRVEKILAKHGRTLDGVDTGEQTALTTCLSASAQGLDIAGERAGQSTLRLMGQLPRLHTTARPQALAEVGGFNVHAKTFVDGRDRNALERLCRYVARPPLANDRLHVLDDGRVQYDMKRRWADGTEAIVLDALSFIARLCALVPAPYFNLTRYHGVLAPNSRLRAEVVLRQTGARQPEVQLCLPSIEFDELPIPPTRPSVLRTPGRHPWAELLKRTFRHDVTVCPNCAGPLRLVEVAHDPASIARVMTRAGLGPMPPPPPALPVPIRGQIELPI